MGARAAALVLAVAWLATATETMAQQRLLYGAIAYSPKTRVIGVASDNASQAEAEEVALQNCRAASPEADDCKNVMWVRNACAALAVGTEGGWGTDWGADRPTAERKALAICAKYSSTCEVVRRVCTLPGR